MIKFFTRFFILILTVTLVLVIYLSYFGVKTDKFNDLIISKANTINKNVKLEFSKTKIHFNLKELNLVVKLEKPKVLVKENDIDLSELDLFLPLRSFITSDFILERVEISFKENDIDDLTKITNIFLPKLINNRLKKIFAEGKLKGEFIIPFKSDGRIEKNYSFSGSLLNASINLTDEIFIKNLTTDVRHIKKNNVDVFNIKIEEGFLSNLQLSDTTIDIERDKNKAKVKSLLRTNGKINYSQIKKISSLFGFDKINFKEINGKVDLKTKINFEINKKFKIKNLSYSSIGTLSNLEIHHKERKIIKKYLPDYDNKLILKDTNLSFTNSNNDQTIKLEGFIKTKDSFDSFKLKQIYNYKTKSFIISGFTDLTNSKLKISQLNYYKDYGEKSKINFKTNFVLNKYYNIEDLVFSAKDSNIHMLNIKMNKIFEINNFDSVKIKTFKKNMLNNDFTVKNSKKIIIKGDIFDAEPLLKTLYQKKDKNTFSKKFNSEVKINFNKAITGTNDDIFNFSMIAYIRKGSYEKLNLKANFSENEIIEMSIYPTDNDKKTLQVISDRARPFIKNFDFVKGFEGGKLEYESVISKDITNSNLSITDFKVSKVPALAKLLTLASLQGIADTLSGEGIRFDSFEMKSNSKANLLNIEDALAIGPAVSILLDGYVDKGKIVSLRGTLVPATKLNSIISSIPVVGDILVGKKTGEGVVGVSFKMKGPPKDIKTTVNPIKTLTPRFIVRAVEKMKKEKKEETK